MTSNHTCERPDCNEPKVPGQGGRLCQRHRDQADLWRRKERHRIPDCQWPDCPEPKLYGRGHKYCAKHSAESLARETTRIGQRARERRLGLTEPEYQAKLATQGGLCAICGNGKQRRQLSVDHDHVTGQVRDLLCDRCNPLLGYARDDIAVLQAAIEYLTRWRR